MSSKASFYLFDYFNAKGQQVERILIPVERDPEASEMALAILENDASLEANINHMKAEAKAAGEVTRLEDAALALTALISEVVRESISIHDAREILSISVNFGKPLTIPEVMPAVEIGFGANAANWARGIFPHLRLGHPGLH